MRSTLLATVMARHDLTAASAPDLSNALSHDLSNDLSHDVSHDPSNAWISRRLAILQRLGSVAFVTVLTAVAAQISIPLPFTPVPFTFQPMIVLVGAAALGARLGAASQLAYLALGIAGLPVFAASPVLPQGVARLLGPTGGYLMAYPFAACVTGWLAERGLDRRYLTAVLAMACGLGVIFTGGLSWLALYAQPGRGLSGALRAGFYPFIAGDLVKLLLAAAVMPSLWSLVRATDRR